MEAVDAAKAKVRELESVIEKALTADPARRAVILDALQDSGEIQPEILAELARAEDKTNAIRALGRAIQKSPRASRLLGPEEQKALRELPEARRQLRVARDTARENERRRMKRENALDE
jgi:hypothetical protein